MSPPMRRRGLKPQWAVLLARLEVSPPMRRRGLKRGSGLGAGSCQEVASHAEAWIETDVM